MALLTVCQPLIEKGKFAIIVTSALQTAKNEADDDFLWDILFEKESLMAFIRVGNIEFS